MRWRSITEIAASGALILSLAGYAAAQDKTTLIFTDVSPADVPRNVALEDIFAKRIADFAELQPHYQGTLFKQGTELVAIQRGNAQMASLPPSDFANQVPAFDILGAAYVIRDAKHLRAVFNSDVGDYFRKLAREKLGVEILAPVYYGTRQVNLRGDKHIETPADMAGLKLRMPGGDSWQFLGSSLGANPVPIAYSELYTALQTGAVDGQDNPLPNDKVMKFYEVTDQIVLTGHNVGFGLLIIGSDVFDKLTPEQQQTMRDAANEAYDWADQQYLNQEAELVQFFKDQGLDVYTPDVDAFRAYAQKKYKESPFSASWPEGMLDKINAL
jgi:TRAP-type C4-dicarboxylate transport system substrate-binding protein